MTRCRWTLPSALLALLGCAAAASGATPPPDQTSPLPNPTGCDTIDASACMLPFPNDLYTRADPASPTGRRVDFNLLAMPRNIAGKPIDPTDENRSDGFSPGSPVITKIAGLDTDRELDATGAARLWDPQASLARNASILVIDAATGRRQMVWAELDHSIDALGAEPADRDLIIRPSKNFLEGHRYIVALRLGLGFGVDPTFRAYRDRTAITEGNPLQQRFDEQRRAHFEALFATLKRAGVARASLTQAWDFTVASGRNIAGRMLAIRNDAFHQLGDDDLGDLKVEGHPPAFTLNRIVDYTCGVRAGTPLDQDLIVVDASCPSGKDGPIAYDVKGTMDVPCYLSTPACLEVHSHFILNPATGLPVQIPGNVMKVDFRCRVPQVALDHPGESRPSLYGHGLFGGYGEIGQGQLKNMMAEHDFTYCATNWAGMATEDIPNVATILTDVSNFNTLADRVQQGMLNFLYLGRLMIHPQGLCSEAAFRVEGRCILDTRRLYYDGNSQGGIIGGALTAVAPDFTRATLGVLGMNYSTLLTRSTDFGTGAEPPALIAHPGNYGPGHPPGEGDIVPDYAYPLYQAYPQFNERPLIFAIMQMLWDRAEPDGYAQHMTDHPYPDTPAHEVLLMAGYGDHQVSNVAAEVEARTIGARVLRRDMLRPNRPWEDIPFVGLKPVAAFPARGISVLTIWDGGSRPAPLGNIAQSKAKDDDPHEWVRNTVAARAMKSAFLDYDSTVVDTCTHADPATGASVPYCDTDQKSDDYDKSPTYEPK